MTQNIQPIGPSGNTPNILKAKVVDPKVKQQGLENDLFTLSYQHHSRDGKFSLTQCFKNVGQGIWDGIKGIGKALTTPVGFLTAAAVVGLSIAFPPLGVAIGAGFMLFGAAKVIGNTGKIIGEYSKGNKDAAEAKANGVGEGLLEVGLGYLGVKGGIKAMKAKGMNPKTYFTDGAKNMYNSGKAKVLGLSHKVQAKLGRPAPQEVAVQNANTSNLPAIRQNTPTEITSYTGKTSGSNTGSVSSQPNPNVRALPEPKHVNASANNAKAITDGKTINSKGSAKTTTSGKTVNTDTSTANTTKAITDGKNVQSKSTPKTSGATTEASSVIQNALKDIHRIDNAKKVTFFERVGGRSVKQTVKNPYEVLGVDKNSSPAQIKTAYRKLATQFHPDKAKNISDSYMTDVNLSYEILTNSSKRAALNFELK